MRLTNKVVLHNLLQFNIVCLTQNDTYITQTLKSFLTSNISVFFHELMKVFQNFHFRYLILNSKLFIILIHVRTLRLFLFTI